MYVSANFIVLIISQHIHVSNHHIVHLKFTPCYLSIVSQQSWKKMHENKLTFSKKLEIKYIFGILLMSKILKTLKLGFLLEKFPLLMT